MAWIDLPNSSRLIIPMTRGKVQSILLVAIIIISYGINATTQPAKVQALPGGMNQQEGRDIQIQLVNLEVEVGNRFVILEELSSKGLNPEESTIIPLLVNKSAVRVNTSYSTIIGDSRSFVIHEFAVDVYQVRSGEQHTLNRTWTVDYRFDEPEENVLPPDASKTEVLEIPSLILPTYGTYKFVFRVQYHIFKGDTFARDSTFPTNMTFEFVSGYPTSPVFLLYLFFFVSVIFIALIAIGVYGDRKYQ